MKGYDGRILRRELEEQAETDGCPWRLYATSSSAGQVRNWLACSCEIDLSDLDPGHQIVAGCTSQVSFHPPRHIFAVTPAGSRHESLETNRKFEPRPNRLQAVGLPLPHRWPPALQHREACVAVFMAGMNGLYLIN